MKKLELPIKQARSKMTFKAKKLIIAAILLGLFGLSLKAEIYYPWKNIYIGSYQNNAWAGLILAPHRDSVFALRLRIKKGDEVADKDAIFYLVSEVGPHAPDGQYARIKIDLSLTFNQGNETPILIKPSPKSDTLILEWSRQDEKTVVGRIKSPKGVRLDIVNYFPWNFKGKYMLLADGQVAGESAASKKYHYLLWTNRRGELGPEAQKKAGRELVLSFAMEDKKEVYFVAGVGENA
ncbi:MAG: hypothetical protein ACE5GI_07480, partial [Candidatus Aminicenantales bacterium]